MVQRTYVLCCHDIRAVEALIRTYIDTLSRYVARIAYIVVCSIVNKRRCFYKRNWSLFFSKLKIQNFYILRFHSGIYYEILFIFPDFQSVTLHALGKLGNSHILVPFWDNPGCRACSSFYCIGRIVINHETKKIRLLYEMRYYSSLGRIALGRTLGWIWF